MSGNPDGLMSMPYVAIALSASMHARRHSGSLVRRLGQPPRSDQLVRLDLHLPTSTLHHSTVHFDLRPLSLGRFRYPPTSGRYQASTLHRARLSIRGSVGPGLEHTVARTIASTARQSMVAGSAADATVTVASIHRCGLGFIKRTTRAQVTSDERGQGSMAQGLLIHHSP